VLCVRNESAFLRSIWYGSMYIKKIYAKLS